ncbi:hypothetical protein Tco_0507730 [Tanacetum coccineum]
MFTDIELNEMKNMMKSLVPTPAPIKAVEEGVLRVVDNYYGTSGSSEVSISMPSSIWKKLGLPDLTSRKILLPGRFCDFRLCCGPPSSFDSLGRHFLSTAHALIDVYEGEIILRHDDQSLILKCGDTPTISYDNCETVKRIDLIDATCAEYAPQVLDFTKSGDSTSILFGPHTFIILRK